MSNFTKYLAPFKMYINGQLADNSITGFKIKDGLNGKYLILFSLLTESESNFSFEQGDSYNITIQFLNEKHEPIANSVEIKAICQSIELNAFSGIVDGKKCYEAKMEVILKTFEINWKSLLQ